MVLVSLCVVVMIYGQVVLDARMFTIGFDYCCGL